MTRTMYDSVNVQALPADATMIGVYVDGLYANEQQARDRFPHAQLVTITVAGQAGAHVVDCETGDLTPQHAAEWAQREQNAGRLPTIYCNASTWPDVRQRCQAGGVRAEFWIAEYDGNPTLPAGAVAKQYRSDTTANVDWSVVADHWPGVDPEPTAPTAPTAIPQPEAGTDVKYLIKKAGSPQVWITDLIVKRKVVDQADLGICKRIGKGKAVDPTIYTVPSGFVDAIKEMR